MCGITGAVWGDPRMALRRETLRRMTEVLRHRGPDDEGEYSAEYKVRPGRQTMPGVALGQRRLSIIDVAGGRQPMSNEDGTVWLVFNGEIYNFRRLRSRLEGGGHRFRTDCDTETIVHLYEDEGPDMLRHLNGMFSLAVWDSRRRRLLIARDRLGQKPLVYCEEPGRLTFASELKSLLQVPGMSREIDPRAIDEYLTYQYVPHPRTIFRHIAKLPPACYGLYRNGSLEVKRYWQPMAPASAAKAGVLDEPADDEKPTADDVDYAAELREKLTESVELRMRSDVPLGAFLSGGIDSTLVVGLMSQLSAEPVRTFSIGFPVPEYDETSFARMAAERFGTVHEEFVVEPNALDILPKLIWNFDEPFGDSSAIPTWYVSQLSRQHVTVALTGDGGDELFLGYPRYRAVSLSSKIPGFLRRMCSWQVWQKIPASPRQKSRRRQMKRFIASLALSPRRRYLEWISIFQESQRGQLYEDSFLASLPNTEPMEFLDDAFNRAEGLPPVAATGLADLLTYLPCDLMTKVDMSSMAHSLECRQPFLDHRVVELAVRMPERLRFRRGRGKLILNETFADILPEPIQRRPKMGFGVPLDHWFRDELKDYAREILLDARTTARGNFREDYVRELLDDHQAGRFDHASRLWSLLVLELWHREWVDAQ